MFGVELPADEVETVGGLLAQTLGRVPIPGASVDVGGLHLIAEGTTGRRNRIDSVLVRRVAPTDPERDRADDEERHAPIPSSTEETLHADRRELTAEDAKLVTLARSARARVGAAEGAAVRDQDGRTYAAATVALPTCP